MEIVGEVTLLDIENMALKLQETTDRSIRNEGRIKKLEGEHQALHQLATSVAVMAEQIKTMTTSVDVLSGKVDDIEGKPAKRLDHVVEKIVLTIVATIVGFILAKIGINF